MNPFWQENVTVSDSSRQLLSESGEGGMGENPRLGTSFGAFLQTAVGDTAKEGAAGGGL